MIYEIMKNASMAPESPLIKERNTGALNPQAEIISHYIKCCKMLSDALHFITSTIITLGMSKLHFHLISPHPLPLPTKQQPSPPLSPQHAN